MIIPDNTAFKSILKCIIEYENMVFKTRLIWLNHKGRFRSVLIQEKLRAQSKNSEREREREREEFEVKPGWREAWLREASAKERTSWFGSSVADKQLRSHCWSWSITFAVAIARYQNALTIPNYYCKSFLFYRSLFLLVFPLSQEFSRFVVKIGNGFKE